MWIRIGAVGSLLSFSLAIIHTNISESLFPAIPLCLATGAIAFIPAAYYRRDDTSPVILGIFVIISLSVTIRLYILHYPASLIGLDPDLYAGWINGVIQTGSIEAIDNSFYSRAPLFPLLTALTGLVLGLKSASAFSIYPIILGVAVPLFAGLFARQFAPAYNRHAMLGAVILGALSVTSFRFSYWPIAHVLGVVYLTLFVYITAYNGGDEELHSGWGKKWRILAVILLFGLLFTHKMTLLLAAVYLITAIILWLFRRLLLDILGKGRLGLRENYHTIFIICMILIVVVWVGVTSLFSTLIFQIIGVISALTLLVAFWYSPPPLRPVHRTRVQRSTILLIAISFALIAVQWTFTTDYLGSFIYNFGSPFLSQGVEVSFDNPVFTSANTVDAGIWDIFFHHHAILLVSLIGVMVLGWRFIYSSNDQSLSLALVFIVFVMLPFSLTGASSVGIGAPRAFVNAEALLAALLAVGLLTISSKKYIRILLVMVLIVIIVFQAFSVGMVPDYPETYRSYLNDQEVEGKSFGHKHINGVIHTDYYFSQESVLSEDSIRDGLEGRYKSVNLGYLSGTFLEIQPEYIAQRTSIDIYRFNISGHWRLEWNPMNTFNKRYSRVYDNAGVRIFTNRNGKT